MISILVFLLVLSIMVVIHEFGHMMAAKKAGVRVERFALGFGRVLFARTRNGTEYALCAIPLGGYVKLAGDSEEEYKGLPDEYLSKPAFKRFLIIVFGPLLNYLLGLFLFCFIFMAGYPNLSTTIGKVMPGMGAQSAGLKEGDSILSVEGVPVEHWEDIQRQIQLNTGKRAIMVKARRDGADIDYSVPLVDMKVKDDLGQPRLVGRMGIKPTEKVVFIRYGFFAAIGKGVSKTIELTVMTYKAFYYMLVGKMSARESVTGPLGIFIITSEAAKMGVIVTMHLMAVLSISLGIFNLLPLPVLDGGHVLLLAVEKVRGKRLGKKAEEIFMQSGFGLIIFLAVLVSINDLARFGFFEKIFHFFGGK